MDYEKFLPSENLSSFINCFWTLEITTDKSAAKQRIVPDGCIELAFILGDDIKRYTSEHEYILQPRAMVLGQTVSPFYIQPIGYVHTFAASFFPYAFSHFISKPIKSLKIKKHRFTSYLSQMRPQSLKVISSKRETQTKGLRF
ncbi:hypothetical protein NI376_21905 [Pseudoalteromonas piscicida]|nr:DUF6597 domain-containing transcriptional factor [Pseudoalteromonas piscicida]WMO15895.1 hypothetical protein NI376_21905 [Pseudoalteromonas piscicida]